MTDRKCSKCDFLIDKSTHKHCVGCGTHKQLTDENWYMRSGRPNKGWCRECRRIQLKERYNSIPHEERKAKRDSYRVTNRDRILEQKRASYRRSKERGLSEQQILRRRERGMARYHSDKLRCLLSGSLNKSLKSKGLRKRNRPFEQLVDWTVEELRIHLTELFDEGMDWSNYGKWHVDHIVPTVLVPFTGTDDPLFRRLWSLNNLAPLWESDNESKKHSLVWQLPNSYTNPKLRALYEFPDPVLLGAITA